MITRFNKWLRSWMSRGRDIWIPGHIRSAPGQRPPKAQDEVKPLILIATKEFLLPTDVGKALVKIAEERIAMALRELRSEREAEGEASLMQMEATNHRLNEVDDAVEELRSATAVGRTSP